MFERKARCHTLISCPCSHTPAFSGLSSSQFATSAHSDKLSLWIGSPLLLPHPHHLSRGNQRYGTRQKQDDQGRVATSLTATFELHMERNTISKGLVLLKDIVLVSLTMINSASGEPGPTLGSGTPRQLAGTLRTRIPGSFINNCAKHGSSGEKS